jgi:hypothetical protein
MSFPDSREDTGNVVNGRQRAQKKGTNGAIGVANGR